MDSLSRQAASGQEGKLTPIDAITGQGGLILQMSPLKDEALLVWGNAFAAFYGCTTCLSHNGPEGLLLLNSGCEGLACFQIGNGPVGTSCQSQCQPGECLYEHY